MSESSSRRSSKTFYILIIKVSTYSDIRITNLKFITLKPLHPNKLLTVLIEVIYFKAIVNEIEEEYRILSIRDKFLPFSFSNFVGYSIVYSRGDHEEDLLCIEE